MKILMLYDYCPVNTSYNQKNTILYWFLTEQHRRAVNIIYCVMLQMFQQRPTNGIIYRLEESKLEGLEYSKISKQLR
jgi:hypothetical protein